MKDGYAGKILLVDLSAKDVKHIKIKEETKRKFLGGAGFAAKLLYEHVPKKCNPLDSDNAIILATGPATGTLLPSSSITAAATKSPLTGFIMRSMMAGHFGPELKQAGFDVLIIKGKSEFPVYISIENENVLIKDAKNLWGLKTSETQDELNKNTNYHMETVCIGPAGENLVKYSTAVSGTRVFGRGGLGAVFGSKNLKGISVRGTKNIQVPDSKKMFKKYDEWTKALKETPQAKSFPTYGSTASPASYSAMGILGTNNWQTETFEGAEQISGELNKEKGYHVSNRSCHNCLLQSDHIWQTKEGLKAGGPEYETLWSIGAMCGNDDFSSIVEINRYCDDYGIDTISFGATISFAMECFEKGLIDEEITGGLELKFGNQDAMISLLHKTAYREGFGDLLSKGTKIAAEIIGGEAKNFAMQTKGLEFAGHSSRAHKAQALGYATSNRGGSHQDTRTAPERSGKFDREAVANKGEVAKEMQDATTIGDSLTLCRRLTEALWGYFLIEDFVEATNLVTSHKYTLEELILIAERIYTTEKMFNIREGAARKDDDLPKRFKEEPIPEGKCKGSVVTQKDLDLMLDEYYKIRDWDIKTSIPTEGCLRKLGLNWMIKDINN